MIVNYDPKQLVRSIPRISAPYCHLLGKIKLWEHSSQRDICYLHHGQPF